MDKRPHCKRGRARPNTRVWAEELNNKERGLSAAQRAPSSRQTASIIALSGIVTELG